MARYTATVDSPLPAEGSFAYLAAFDRVDEWDPSIDSAERIGDERFRIVTRVMGREVELEYETREKEPPRRLVMHAETPLATSHDTITVEPAGSGSRGTYDALLQPKGLLRLLDPVIALGFRRTSDKARKGLERRLRELGAA